MKTVVIMQPTFVPWSGLFEQIRLADVFVHFDDAQFSKGGLTNRVKIKTARGPKWLTVPLMNLRLGQSINEVRMDRTNWRRSHLDKLRQAYADAPFVDDMLAIVETVYGEPHVGIAALDIAAIEACCRYLRITTQCVRSRELDIDAIGSERVLRIVQELGADVYVTGHGAANYLDHEAFDTAGVRVEYMAYQRREYPQLHGPFDPHLSVLDLIANCGPHAIDYVCSTTVPWMEFVQG